MIENIPNFEGLNCTINTTEDCNLRCKYCYEINKTSSCKSRGVKLKEKNISFTFNDVEGEDYEEGE